MLMLLRLRAMLRVVLVMRILMLLLLLCLLLHVMGCRAVMLIMMRIVVTSIADGRGRVSVLRTTVRGMMMVIRPR